MKRILILVCAALATYIQSGAATVKMATETFVTNKVETAVIVVSNYVGSAISKAAADKNIAMFIVPVNHDANGQFTGFELKASTNNFSHASEHNGLQFYAQSEVADTGENGWDRMKMYIGTSYLNSHDVRAYTKLPNTLTWTNDLFSVVVLVDASCIARYPGDWLREDNGDLMWCYMRNTAGGVEHEPGTDKTLWRPIAPVRWFSMMPEWAK